MDYKRIVIKVGTNVLTTEDGKIDTESIHQFAGQIAQLKQMGKEPILVSSGAVGVGRARLDLPAHLNVVTQRQVWAAVGQVGLISLYQEAFAKNDTYCAQILVTKEDFRDRDHYINMNRCLNALLRDHIVPIVNENDVISISELMFTDNDELAGLIAGLVNAEALIIYSNVDGVLHRDGHLIRSVGAGDQSIYDHINSGKSSFGRGGMLTKVRICQHAAKLGVHAYIANGKKADPVELLRADEPYCTHFKAKETKTSNVKKWMTYQKVEQAPVVFINEGAVAKLSRPDEVASLLPVGITKVDGSFKKGDLVRIYGPNNHRVGLGIAAYSDKKLTPILGENGQKAFIHYDYLLIHD